MSTETSLESWEFLKARLRELGLAGPHRSNMRREEKGEERGQVQGAQGGVMRTKANCLQVCKKGPIAVVYPEGIARQSGARHAAVS